MPEPTIRPKATGRLFYQIALRLIAVAAVFTLLEIGIVLVMYLRDPETLAADLVSLEAERVAGVMHARGAGLMPNDPALGSATRAVAVFGENGAQLLLSNPGHLLLPEPPLADARSLTARETHGELFYLTGIRQVDVGGRRFWVAVAVSGKGFRPFVPALLKEVSDHALLPLIPLSLLLLAFNVIVVRRMLAPLERAMRDVDALDGTNPQQRLQLTDSPIEVGTLVRAINRALDRLARVMDVLRQFTADAAHELRTPLAAMTLTIERLPQSAERRKLAEDAASMKRLIAQLLDLARADALDNARDARTDLDEFASRVVAELTPLALEQGRTLRYRNDGSVLVEGREELLERALRNVVENALKHSPSGGEVEVVVGPAPQVQVIDRGPGIPVELRQKVFERFWRDERLSRGAGLGLAIAKRIVEACGGSISIADAPGGGALVALGFSHPAVSLPGGASSAGAASKSPASLQPGTRRRV